MWHKIKFAVCAALCGALPACGLVELALTDIGGWNLSACADDVSLCFDLFADNAGRIEGGTGSVLDVFGSGGE